MRNLLINKYKNNWIAFWKIDLIAMIITLIISVAINLESWYIPCIVCPAIYFLIPTFREEAKGLSYETNQSTISSNQFHQEEKEQKEQ